MGDFYLGILGSGAGGGCPQWNCRCRVCRLYWDGDKRVSSRTQSSIAVSADGEQWTLINCSPDIKQQILDNPYLHPKIGLRHSPIHSVIVTNADIDHIGGLLTLRESQAFALHMTSEVAKIINTNSIFDVLQPELVQRNILSVTESSSINGIVFTPFLVPGKVPLYLEQGEVITDQIAETTIGMSMEVGHKKIIYIPGCAVINDDILQRVEGADILLFDGTVFIDDEMQEAGVGEKTGKRMGHVQLSGKQGSLQQFSQCNIKEKIFIHINNTNPILIKGSKEQQAVHDAGWQVGFDKMQLVL